MFGRQFNLEYKFNDHLVNSCIDLFLFHQFTDSVLICSMNVVGRNCSQVRLKNAGEVLVEAKLFLGNSNNLLMSF